MKRNSGFKVLVPYIITAFAESGLPIFITCDITAAEMIVKPGYSNIQQIPDFIQSLYADNKELKDFIDNCSFDFKLIHGQETYVNLYMQAAFIYALFEEKLLAEDLHELLNIIHNQLNKSTFACAFVKSTITGGINLSTPLCHERLYGSKGLFFLSTTQHNYTENTFYPIESASILTTALIKDNMDLLGRVLQLLEGRNFRKIHDEHIGNLICPNTNNIYHVLLMNDQDLLGSSDWLACVNQEGVIIG